MRSLLVLSSSSRHIPQDVVFISRRLDFISCASVCDGLFSELDDVRCLFFVEKKRCCFSAFLFGGTLRFRVRVTGVSLAALSATIVELR